MSTAFKFKPHYVVFSLFAALLALSHPCSGNPTNQTNDRGFPLLKYTLHVVNQMGASRTLVAHCESQDDDLGIRDISAGNEFNWSFRENISGSTLYWCDMHNDHQHASFKVFWPESNHSWLRYRCNYKECFWIAKDDGIYLRVIPENHDEFQLKWEPG